MNNDTQFVFNVKALGQGDNGIVTRIAITPFNINDVHKSVKDLIDDTLYIALDKDAQSGERDANTMSWYQNQSDVVRQISIGDTKSDLSIDAAFDEIEMFLHRHNYKYKTSCLWGRGYGYIAGKLDFLSKSIGRNSPLNTWNWHESRTLNHILTSGSTTKYEVNPNHKIIEQYAKHDAALEAYRIIQLWNSI